MAYIDKHLILEGAVTLYKRDSEGGDYESQNWYAAFNMPETKTIRRSLKTSSLDEAKTKARNKYFELLHRAQAGLSLSPKSFESVAKSFLLDFEKQIEIWNSLDADGQSNMGNISPNILEKNRPIIENYLIPHFSGKFIQEITEKDIEDYKTFRWGYWTSKARLAEKTKTYIRNGKRITRPKRNAEKSVPSYSTINKELTALRKIFEFARKLNIVSPNDLPSIHRLTKPAGYNKTRERPSFTNDELVLLLDTVRTTYKSQNNSRIANAQLRLYLYIQLMSYSGMRVTEAKNLKFSDIELRNPEGSTPHFVVHVKGKNMSRELVPLPDFGQTYAMFRALSEIGAQLNKWKFSEDTYVLSNEYGQRINSFDKTLSHALNSCKLLYAKNGRRRNAGSFRSFYITSALVSGLMTHIQLALNCGTSVAVIEKHYNRMNPSNFPEKFNFENAASRISFKHMELDYGEIKAVTSIEQRPKIISNVKMKQSSHD